MTFVHTPDDLLARLEDLPCPFFVDVPDENLLEWFDTGLLTPGRGLELGCGNGRNAVFLAGRGCTVDAVDFSAEALGWAREQLLSVLLATLDRR